jgi:hypothetical protein
MHASPRGDKVANTFDSLASQMLTSSHIPLSYSCLLLRLSLPALQVARAISFLQDLLKMRACDPAQQDIVQPQLPPVRPVILLFSISLDSRSDLTPDLLVAPGHCRSH